MNQLQALQSRFKNLLKGIYFTVFSHKTHFPFLALFSLYLFLFLFFLVTINAVAPGNLRLGPLVSLRIGSCSMGSKRNVSSSSSKTLPTTSEDNAKSKRLKALMGIKPNLENKPVLKVELSLLVLFLSCLVLFVCCVFVCVCLLRKKGSFRVTIGDGVWLIWKRVFG